MQARLVEEHEATPEVQAIYDEIKSDLGIVELPNWVKALGGNPNVLKANWEKAKNTMIEGRLPALLKELIIFKVSVNNGSQYCSSCHAHGALQADKSLSYDDLIELAQGSASSKLPEAFQVALDIVPRVIKNPTSLSEEDVQRLNDQGFGEEEIMELLAQGDLALMFNAITMMYNVPLDEGYKDILDDIQEASCQTN